MKTKHYFKLAFSSHLTENITFLIDCNRDPWRLFCKRGPHNHFQTWEPIPCDGVALKQYFQNTARPETWEKETHPFRKKHQTIYTGDYDLIEAEWNFGQGVERRMYSLGVYDEGLLVGVREARRCIKYFENLCCLS